MERKCELKVRRKTPGGQYYKDSCGAPAAHVKITGPLTNIEMDLCGLHRSHVERFYHWKVEVINEPGSGPVKTDSTAA